MDGPATMVQSDAGSVVITPAEGDRTRFTYRGSDGGEYTTELRPAGAAALSELDDEELVGFFELAAGETNDGLEEPGMGNSRDVELAELDRNWMLNEADKACGESGMLDPAKVDEVRRFRGCTTGEAQAMLSEALEGQYQGSAEGGRRLLQSPGLVQRRAQRKGISTTDAAVELAGTGTPEGSEQIADLAEEYAKKHEVDLATATIAVQKGER